MRYVLAAIALSLAAPSGAREVGGVQVPETITAGGRELKLNGAGIRKKSFLAVKVYVGALYLPAPSRDAAAIVAADEPKVVRMRFLRDVTRDQVMGAFRDGFHDNSPADAAALVPKLDAVAAILPDELKEGAELDVSYLPGQGSAVSVAGGRTATIEGKAFADALFRNWLGPKPADGDLKKDMLAGR